jgi:biotin carboxyl carrier protein
VQKDQLLLILEAMKMENEIFSPVDVRLPVFM